MGTLQKRDEFELIRLNLERMDALTSNKPLVDRLFSSAPVLPFTIAFGLGILLAYKIRTPSVVWIAVCGMTIMAGLCLFFTLKTKKGLRLALALTGACLAVLALGTVRSYSVTNIAPNHISGYLQDQRELATLEGKVISSVRNDAPSRGLSSIPWLGSQSSFCLETERVKTPSGWQKAIGKVRVQISEPVHHVQPGNTVRIDCWLSRFTPPPNPGQFDLQKHMHQRGVYLAAAVPIAEGVRIVDPSVPLLPKIRSVLYPLAAGALLDEPDTTVRSLTSALLLGRRSGLSPQIMAAFRDTNLAHFISLSGMHVGILAASLWGLLRITGLAKRPRAVLCIVLILLYAMIVPARAPTMRAVFISCFFFASVLFKRQVSALNTLSLSALVLLFIHPYDLFAAGWQLSFLSVLGILLFFPTMKIYFLTKLFYPVAAYLPKSFTGVKRFLRAAIELLAVGVSVWITIASILLYYFGQINPLSPLWTVLVLPLVMTILYAGFAKILLSSLFPTIAAIFGWILNHAATGFGNTVVILSKIDFFRVFSYRPGLSLVLTIYFLMLTLCLLSPYYWRLKKGIVLLILLCFLYPGISSHFQINDRDDLEITCLSVGHGQAIVLSAPGNEHFLFDAGSITNRNLANKTILPFLQHQSIFSLDTVCLSHGDMDHINAVGDIAASIKIKNIYANEVLLDSAQKPSIEKEICQALTQRGQTIKPFGAYHGPKGLAIKSIWPDETILSEPSASENDKSEVLLIEYAGRKILLCGDIERTAQNRLTKCNQNLTVDVLILPHHGSTNNMDAGFIAALKPDIIIASCSRRSAKNAYRPDEGSSTQAFYTASDGAVTVMISADGELEVEGFLRTTNEH
ncbi:MAG: DNA internalization-related competence protein ComEC/Rec2 [Planctomycetales bacterium 4572_13]|nr:MAG: DNA internalization-related competence protein ComEC/Rec2 [Planctomycetales bacterium 4572_13]